MTSDRVKCGLCGGDGHYCWQCGERERNCICDNEHSEVYVCDQCEGTGEVDEVSA